MRFSGRCAYHMPTMPFTPHAALLSRRCAVSCPRLPLLCAVALHQSSTTRPVALCLTAALSYHSQCSSASCSARSWTGSSAVQIVLSTLYSTGSALCQACHTGKWRASQLTVHGAALQRNAHGAEHTRFPHFLVAHELAAALRKQPDTSQHSSLCPIGAAPQGTGHLRTARPAATAPRPPA